MSLSTTLLDRYIDHQSVVHALDPRVKLVLAGGYILAIALLPIGSWLALGLFAIALWWAVGRANLSVRMIITRAFVALPFALVAVTIIFTRPGEPLFRLPVGFATLTATDAGLAAFMTIVVKSWLSVQAALLLTMTTHFLDVLHGLRALRLPHVLVSILSFMYRYLFVLIDEAQRMLRARECRSAELPGRRGGGSLVWRAMVVGRMVGTLFLRSYERSERIYIAMLSRGYSGEVRAVRLPQLDSTARGLLITVLALYAAVTGLAFIL